MKIFFRNVLYNSILAFLSAFQLTTLFHEFGHFISYYFFGAHPELFHNYVQIPDQQLSIQVKIISALAGPLFSLVQGIIFGIILLKRQNNGNKELLFLWMSLLGFVNFFGYLMLTPLSSAGDTGKVAELLGMHFFSRVLISIVGISILIIIVIKVGKYFSAFMPAGLNLSERRKFVNCIMFYPILAGGVVNTVLAFPLQVTLSAIYPATSSFVILSAYGRILKAGNLPVHNSHIEKKISVHLLILTIGLIILNRLLTCGIG